MNTPPMSEAERRKRLAAVYNLLLDLAAKKRAREAAQQQAGPPPELPSCQHRRSHVYFHCIYIPNPPVRP